MLYTENYLMGTKNHVEIFPEISVLGITQHKGNNVVSKNSL